MVNETDPRHQVENWCIFTSRRLVAYPNAEIARTSLEEYLLCDQLNSKLSQDQRNLSHELMVDQDALLALDKELSELSSLKNRRLLSVC